MKEFDPSIKVWKKLADSPDIIYQTNSLPWPLATREFLVSRQLFSDDEGEWVVVLDAEHPGAPTEKGAVKARSVINANIFLQTEGGVKWWVGRQSIGRRFLRSDSDHFPLSYLFLLISARVVQVDPAGSIPSFVVNAKASDFMVDVERMRKFPG